MQNENVGPLIRKLSKISRGWQQSIKSDAGPSGQGALGACTGCTLTKLALIMTNHIGPWAQLTQVSLFWNIQMKFFFKDTKHFQTRDTNTGSIGWFHGKSLLKPSSHGYTNKYDSWLGLFGKPSPHTNVAQSITWPSGMEKPGFTTTKSKNSFNRFEPSFLKYL